MGKPEIVEALCWDLSLGFAETPIGRFILRATSACPLSVPDSVDHVGIKVFGNLYEYGDVGILCTPVDDPKRPISKYPAFKFRAAEVLGETIKTQEEFEDWIEEMNQDRFRGINYDVVEHSCLVWATEAAEFLGVPHHPNWDKLRKYARANRFVASLVGQSVITSRRINFEQLNARIRDE